MTKPAVLAALVCLAEPQAVAACQYLQRPEPVGQTSGEYFARVMAGAASTVDLVLVEDDGSRAQNEPPTGVVTLRTIARLKGNSADRFSLFGSGMTLRPEAERAFAAPLEHFTSETGQVVPFPSVEERQTTLLPRASGASSPFPMVSSSCGPSALLAQTGRFYVVMRGADGHLLNRVPTGDGHAPAFGFVPVRLETDDFWLSAVRLATFEPRPPATPQRLLHLRAGSDPAQVEAALRKARVRIRAAFVRQGAVVDEVRPADAETQAPWLAKAVPLVRQRGKGAIGDPDHGAAEYLRARLGPLQRFGSSLAYEVAQAFAASVRRAQQRERAATLVALEIDGAPEAFAREPFYASSARFESAAPGLAQIAGADEASQFATLQAIERDIWLLNGGNGNRQGTLPR